MLMNAVVLICMCRSSLKVVVSFGWPDISISWKSPILKSSGRPLFQPFLCFSRLTPPPSFLYLPVTWTVKPKKSYPSHILAVHDWIFSLPCSLTSSKLLRCIISSVNRTVMSCKWSNSPTQVARVLITICLRLSLAWPCKGGSRA